MNLIDKNSSLDYDGNLLPSRRQSEGSIKYQYQPMQSPGVNAHVQSSGHPCAVACKQPTCLPPSLWYFKHKWILSSCVYLCQKHVQVLNILTQLFVFLLYLFCLQKAKLAGATQRQTESYLKPLLRKLKNKVNKKLEELCFFNNYHGFSKSSTIRVL